MAVHKHYQHAQVKGFRVGRFNAGINTTFIVYYLDGIVIDTGPSNQWKDIHQQLQHLPVKKLLLTHHHEDHVGNSNRLVETFDIPVFTNAICAHKLDTGYPLPLLRRVVWGAPYIQSLSPHIIDEQSYIETNAGMPLQLILAPGHSDDMSCFYQPDNQWLFSGDLFLSDRIRYLHIDEDLQITYNSLKRMIDLGVKTLFCPHRGIIQDGHGALSTKRDFIANLAQQAQQHHQAGMSIKQICATLLGKEDGFSYLSGFEFSKQRLIKAALELTV